jgi:hypothetical protein
MQVPQKVTVVLHAEMSVVERRVYTQALMVLGYGIAATCHKERRQKSLFKNPCTNCSLLRRPLTVPNGISYCCDLLGYYIVKVTI